MGTALAHAVTGQSVPPYLRFVGSVSVKPGPELKASKASECLTAGSVLVQARPFSRHAGGLFFVWLTYAWKPRTLLESVFQKILEMEVSDVCTTPEAPPFLQATLLASALRQGP